MTNQEIIDAIEAEVRTAQANVSSGFTKIKLGHDKTTTTLQCMAYIDGLNFAKELIDKRAEVTE